MKKKMMSLVLCSGLLVGGSAEVNAGFILQFGMLASLSFIIPVVAIASQGKSFINGQYLRWALNSSSGDTGRVRFYLSLLGADVNATDTQGRGCFQLSLTGRGACQEEMCELLIDYGADFSRFTDNNGKGVLEISAEEGWKSIVKKMYAKGAQCKPRAEMSQMGLSEEAQKVLLDEYSSHLGAEFVREGARFAEVLDSENISRDLRGLIFVLAHGDIVSDSGLINKIEGSLLTSEVLKKRELEMEKAEKLYKARQAKCAEEEIGGLC